MMEAAFPRSGDAATDRAARTQSPSLYGRKVGAAPAFESVGNASSITRRGSRSFTISRICWRGLHDSEYAGIGTTEALVEHTTI